MDSSQYPARKVLDGVMRVGFYIGGDQCPEDIPFPSCLAALLGLLYVIAIPFVGTLLLLAALIEKLWRAVRPRQGAAFRGLSPREHRHSARPARFATLLARR